MTSTVPQVPVWFDEGPPVVALVKAGDPTRYVNTVGIDTSAIDRYRQGVEIVLPAHRALGLAKLGTGEPGSALRQETFGTGASTTGPFADADGENQTASGLESTDGVLEPLGIRNVLSGLDDGRGTRGTLMAGTEDSAGRVPQVVTLYVFEAGSSPPFVDANDSLGSIPSQTGEQPEETARVSPMRDDVVKSGVRLPTLADQAMLTALCAMAPATDTYVDVGWTSGATGFMYDSSPVGTDSLAFGGLER